MITRRDFCVDTIAASVVAGGDLSLLATSSPGLSPLPPDPPEKLDFDLADYNETLYREDVAHLGLAKTWDRICTWLMAKGETGFLRIPALGDLYEEGLAIRDKNDKKASGQYYTPNDVARVMSRWLMGVPGETMCDVGCGTGNLILAYLDEIGPAQAQRLLGAGRVYLYELDGTALTVCLVSIALRYGREAATSVHAFCCDFLNREITLPDNCKVISNPPYAAVSTIPETWERTQTVLKGKELYAAFMEKIMLQSGSSVIITPYSFIGAEKFFPLRTLMNDRSGFVVSFDNVPGMIFKGRKHGIFNSNMGNAVRAAITVVDGGGKEKGFRFSPLIRFKNTERQRLLNCATLEDMLGNQRQRVVPKWTTFAKCDKRLEKIHQAWKENGDTFVGLHTDTVGRYVLSMPNTCRYFTSATATPLSRKGQITLRFSDEDAYWYVFCLINSSFAYWHWRMYDGGITYPLGLLLWMPSFFGKLTADDKKFFRAVSKEMIDRQGEFIIRKANVGIQENVKYPRTFRDRINRRFLRILGVKANESIFDIVHSNMALEVNLCESK